MYDIHTAFSLVFRSFLEFRSVHVESIEMASHRREMCYEKMKLVARSTIFENFVKTEDIEY